jgi:hypothetical protein
MIVGVIHPDLYTINEIFGNSNGFTVDICEEVELGITLTKAQLMFLSLRSLPEKVKGVVHGNFLVYNPNCFRCTFEVKYIGDQYLRSILIKFDEDVFEAPPSLIVTPIEKSNTQLVRSIPTAVVEYVTTKESLVKVFA